MHIQVAITKLQPLIEDKASWALKELKVKQPGIDEEEDMMSRHHSQVAIAFISVQWTMRSRHQREVATGAKQLTEPLCRDVASKLKTVATSTLKKEQSRHQFARKLRS